MKPRPKPPLERWARHLEKSLEDPIAGAALLAIQSVVNPSALVCPACGGSCLCHLHAILHVSCPKSCPNFGSTPFNCHRCNCGIKPKVEAGRQAGRRAAGRQPKGKPQPKTPPAARPAAVELKLGDDGVYR